MATIREYFDTDARSLTVHGNWTISFKDGLALAEVVAKIAYDFEANAKYLYFYVPAMVDLSQCLGVPSRVIMCLFAAGRSSVLGR